ncbi:DMT family transporter [Acuticoccus sp. M5D2P5]|uniref:DMT family transporter n=1 Tax=Acuticoccus kalidii TaxID=2910977 RepID=UPI001F173A1A|nr:DMT family transporter [Acuticoccus kalidii]MCF3934636.1 DMT family transporter [Acuticoccus kalidii]
MNVLGYAALALVAGVGIPVMAAMNGGLGARIGSPVLAAVLLIGVAFLCICAALLVSGLPSGGIAWPAPTISYAAGFFVALYVLSITFLAPRFGVANAIFFVLLGQLVSAALIDHFALFGAPHVPLGLKRTLGLALMAFGVFLARKPL